MDALSSGSSDYVANNWILCYLALKGNEYFCEVDIDYILDRFNLTGLNADVQNYPQALDLITDAMEYDYPHSLDHIETQGRLLYGLVHARYILTTRGLAKMVEKYKRADFGRCPRVLCFGQQLLPVGLSDHPFQKAVKLYCPRCEDIYSPKSSRHGTIDGAFFGTTFPHMLLMVYSHLIPPKQPGGPAPFLVSNGGGTCVSAAAATAAGKESSTSGSVDKDKEKEKDADKAEAQDGTVPVQASTAALVKIERYKPRIFGFPVHETAVLQRWQDSARDELLQRLEKGDRAFNAASAAGPAGDTGAPARAASGAAPK